MGSQVGYVPFDYKPAELGQALGLEMAGRADGPRGFCRTWFRRRGQLGEISQAAADATGIPAGLPLIAAAADKACEVIGAGCLEPHIWPA